MQSDIQATRRLLAQAVERLDQLEGRAEPGQSQAQQSGSQQPQGFSCIQSSGAPEERPVPRVLSSTPESSHSRDSVQGARAYPYNPIPGPTHEHLSLFQSSNIRSFQPHRFRDLGGRSHRRLPPKSKKKKTAIWQHPFICLSECGQTKVPTPLEKARLMQAGLGSKEISFFEHAESSEFHHDLLEAFPKLKGAGGYELLRTSDRSNKEMAVIPPPPGGYTAVYLRAVVAQAKVYVRPLQHNLSLHVETQSGIENVSQTKS